MMRKIMLTTLLLISATAMLSAKEEWVARINKEHLITVKDFNNEFNYYATTSGLDDVKVRKFYNDEEQKREFLERLIDNKVIYLQALEEGIDKSSSVVSTYNDMADEKIIEFYIFNLIDVNSINVSEAEKRALFNERRMELERMAGGAALQYEQVADQLDVLAKREKIKGELETLVEETKKKYDISVTYDIDEDPVAEINAGGDKRAITRKELDSRLKEIEDAGMITKNNRSQVEAGMLEEMINNRILKIKAQKEGFFKTSKPATVRAMLKQKLVVDEYIKRNVLDKIGEPTKAEIEDAIKEYDKRYDIDKLLRSGKVRITDLRKSAKSRVKQEKYLMRYQALTRNLRDQSQIEKRVGNIKR